MRTTAGGILHSSYVAGSWTTIGTEKSNLLGQRNAFFRAKTNNVTDYKILLNYAYAIKDTYMIIQLKRFALLLSSLLIILALPACTINNTQIVSSELLIEENSAEQNPELIQEDSIVSDKEEQISNLLPTTKIPNYEEMFILHIMECDFDGDGTQETIVFKYDLEEDEIVYTESFGGSIEFRETLYLTPFANINPKTTAIDLDDDGGEEIIIIADIGGTGGHGSMSLTILTLDGAVIRQLHAGGLLGYTVQGSLTTDFNAKIEVKETGNSFKYKFEYWNDFIQNGCYSIDGKLLKEESIRIDAICYVNINAETRNVISNNQFI